MSIEIKLTPVTEMQELVRVNASLTVKGRMPARVCTATLDVQESPRGPRLLFAELSPENPGQRTLDEVAPGAFDPSASEE